MRVFSKKTMLPLTRIINKGMKVLHSEVLEENTTPKHYWCESLKKLMIVEKIERSTRC